MNLLFVAVDKNSIKAYKIPFNLFPILLFTEISLVVSRLPLWIPSTQQRLPSFVPSQ